MAAEQSTNPLSFRVEEDPKRYCVGGYHPVTFGQGLCEDRYLVINKLGYGEYSTVWLAFDRQEDRHVAVKILTGASSNDAIFERKILQYITTKLPSHPGAAHVLDLLHYFAVEGPNGVHDCLVTKVMGPHLATFRHHLPGERFPVKFVKHVAKQLLQALVYLHEECGVIHTDIKSSNILVGSAAIDQMLDEAPCEYFFPDKLPDNNPAYFPSSQLLSALDDLSNPADFFSVKLADFGVASWVNEHLTEFIQPNHLRAPEVILGARWDTKVDIWNLGCLIYELITGSMLFNEASNTLNGYTSKAHLAAIEGLLGPMPCSLLDRSDRKGKFYDKNGKRLASADHPSKGVRHSLHDLVDRIAAPDFDSNEKTELTAVLAAMLQLDPDTRNSAADTLKLVWFQH